MSKTGKNYEEIFFKHEKVSKNVICQIKIEQSRLGDRSTKSFDLLIQIIIQ